MNHRTSKWVFTAFLWICMLGVFAPLKALSADPLPGAACAVNGARIFSGGPELTGMGHWLVCSSNVWVASYSSTGTGLLAVGTTDVATGSRVEIAGALRLSQQSGALAGELQLAELLANGTHTVAFRAPSSLANSLTFQLPSVAGTVGHVLTLTGTGTLGFAAASSSLSYPLLSTTRGSAGSPVYSFNADSDTGLFSPGANTLAISTSGTQHVTIQSNGNVGIGTAAPTSTFSVAGDANASARFFYDNANVGDTADGQKLGVWRRAAEGDAAVEISVDQWQAGRIESTSSMVISSPTMLFSASDRISLYPWNSFDISVNGTERLRINSSGQVGIGTSSPAGKLHVRTSGGTTQAFTVDNDLVIQNDTSSGSEAGISIVGGTGGYSTIAFGDSLAQYRTWISSENSTRSLRFGVDYTEQMRLTGDGNLVLGTLASSAGPKLEVLGGPIRASQQSASAAGEVQFAELLANGTHTVALRAPSSITNSYAMILPGTLGAPGQVLVTDGTSSLSWTSVATADSVGTDADAFSAITIDFTNNTGMRATASADSCGTLNVTNLTAGKYYTLTMLNVTATCTTVQWNGSTSNVKLPSSYAAGAPVTGAIYSFYNDGTTLWVSLVPY